MDEILLNLRSVLWRFGQQVGIYKDFIRIGILQETPIMPAVQIVPARMGIMKRYCGGQYVMGREVEIYVYDAADSVDSAAKKVRDIVTSMRDVLQKDLQYQLSEAGKKAAWNYDRGNERYPEKPISIQRQLAMQAVAPYTFFVRQNRPVQQAKKTRRFYATDDQCLQRVHAALFNARQGRLSFVKEFRTNPDPPVQAGLTIGTHLPSANPDHYASGIDSNDLTIATKVWSKLSTEEDSFLANVRAAEIIHEIWERDETFNGAFQNTELQSVEFSTRVDKDVRKYETTLTLLGQKVEPNYNR